MIYPTIHNSTTAIYKHVIDAVTISSVYTIMRVDNNEIPNNDDERA